jgi:hypothetical protein
MRSAMQKAGFRRSSAMPVLAEISGQCRTGTTPVLSQSLIDCFDSPNHCWTTFLPPASWKTSQMTDFLLMREVWIIFTVQVKVIRTICL